MAISLREAQDIDELASIFYEMLPGSGNPRLCFPTVANRLGLDRYWIAGSKRPAIVALLSATYERDRHKFCRLIENVVRDSITWRAGRGNPLSRDEIDDINKVVRKLGFKIPDLHDPDFLSSLERREKTSQQGKTNDPIRLSQLHANLLSLNKLDPVPRGFAFERILSELFAFYQLAPRGSFRIKGEQIDGSFQHDGHTYLLEAKWHNAQIGRGELALPDGLVGFERGRPTALIAVDGSDLHEILSRQLSLPEVLTAKARRAVETNRCFVPVRHLL